MADPKSPSKCTHAFIGTSKYISINITMAIAYRCTLASDDGRYELNPYVIDAPIRPIST